MIPSTTTRVEQHTDEAVNERIRQQMERNIAHVSEQGQEAINRRLEELNYEWDIERTLESNAATITLLGLGLGALVNRRFFVLPALVAGFLLQHTVQGWCPPVPVFRRLGFRTAREIDIERGALKALRGDFSDLPTKGAMTEPSHIRRVIAAMER